MKKFPRFVAETRELLALSVPIIISQVAVQAMGFIDTTMAGQASARDLAAIAVGYSLWMPFLLFLRGVLMALTPVVAHHRGAGLLSEITRDLGQTLWIGLLFSALLIVYMNQAESILVYMNVAPDIIPIAVRYLQALSFGVPAIALFYTLNGLCEGVGDTRAPMVISVIGLILNIPSNYLLIYGKLGFPELGAVGCGWATALVYWVMSGLLWIYMRMRPKYLEILHQGSIAPMTDRIKDMLKLGIPIGITIFIEGSIFAIIALLIGKLGTTVVASHQIALNFSGLLFMVPLSLSFGLTVRAGHALGAGDIEEARFRTLSGTAVTVMFSATSALFILLFPDFVIGLYTSEPDVVKAASMLLGYAALYQISDALQASANGALRGYKDTRIPMVLVTIAYWGVALPLGYVLGMTDYLGAPLGAAGFWIGLVTGLTLAAVFLCSRLAIVFRKTTQSS